MATFVANNAQMTFKSQDFSKFLTSVSIERGQDEIEGTTFGDTLHRMIEGGLKTFSVTAEMDVDYGDANSLDAFLWDNLGTAGAWTFKPVASDAISSDNPEYRCQMILQNAPVVNATVGERSQVSLTFSNAGTPTRVTSP